MRPFRTLLNGYGMVTNTSTPNNQTHFPFNSCIQQVVSTASLVKRFINLYPLRFVLMVYGMNYMINIYCLRMSDISGTQQNLKSPVSNHKPQLTEP